MESKAKIDMFREAINRQADDEIRELTAKIRERKSAAGKAREELAVREEIAAIRANQSAEEARVKKELSRCDFEIARAVRLRRKELSEEFFEEISEKLREFVKSDRYEEYLRKSIEKARSELGEDCVFLAGANDVELVGKLSGKEPKTDPAVLIGGIRAVNEHEGLFGDYTLDKALEDESDAFPQKSELRL